MTETKQLPNRSEMDPRYTWRLEDLFPSDDAWEAEFRALTELFPQVSQYQGGLGDSAEKLLQCFRFVEQVNQRLERLIAYAHMRQDEENTNPKYQALNQRAQHLAIQVESAQAFLVPEILQLGDDIINGFLAANTELQLYAQALDDIRRRKPHTLPEAQEQLLAEMGSLARTPSNVFGLLNDADLRFPVVRDDSGQQVQLTHGRYIELMKSANRDVRREAFEAFYTTYQQFDNTLASLLNASFEKDAFYARVRNYDSALHMTLDSDNIPVAVYDTLIETIRAHLPLMHRYTRLRKQALGVDELHMYDVYAPLVPDTRIKLTYDEAKELLQAALRPLGDDYQQILTEGLEGNWIDVYETVGKTSGAYSYGVYGSHPFILLNYQGSLDDAFTLAHEMGHALHSYLSNATQPYTYAHYTKFVAEVASTVNEALLMHHLLKTTDDVQRRKYIVNHYLEQFRGTVFRQTMFAEFERTAHQLVESGTPLTADVAHGIYRQLNQDYFGPDMVIDQLIEREWTRIPHFYSPFYVFQYATGFSAAVALSQQILTEGQPAVDRYLKFLSSGSADYPLNLLREAGVDMTQPEPIQAAMRVFDNLLDEMEELLVK